MTFYEVLEQVIDLLQRHGRVTYRALKRQYGCDDDFLADLRAEIIQARQVAVDQDGEMLVWTGGAGGPSGSTAAALQPGQPLAHPDAPAGPCTLFPGIDARGLAWGAPPQAAPRPGRSA